MISRNMQSLDREKDSEKVYGTLLIMNAGDSVEGMGSWGRGVG